MTIKTGFSTKNSISTLLVDDDIEFRQGLQFLLNFYSSTSEMRFNVVGRAASADQALALTIEQSPRLILLDLELAKTDGIRFLEQKRSLDQPGKVLILSGHQEDEWVFRAMQAGAQGYLFKRQLSKQLPEAVTRVLQDEVYLSPEAAASFFRMFHFFSGQSLQSCQSVHLTRREKQVLHCVVEGSSNHEIAKHLNITVGTVKAYMTGIFEKLEVTSRTQAALKALKMGLVTESGV